MAAAVPSLSDNEMIVDLFAGAGGASQGIYLATGRHPDVAINHDPEAISVHTRNHPDTEHHCASVWAVDPRQVHPERPIGLLWASPDCRHFSRAAGAGPKSKSVRSLPGVVLTWATRRRPRVIVVENVREMLGWGPLLEDGRPCLDRVGRSFNVWVGRLRGLGYRVQWRELCAADFGAPTIRTRLFIVARLDEAPICWPHPTHARRPGLMGELPWRTAAECIDWSRPCPSIFTRPRPLKEATLRRIAEGVVRYVLRAETPFIVRTGHWSHRSGLGFGFRGQGVDEPLATVATINDKAVIVPHVSALYGTSVGAPATAPLGTTTAGGGHHSVVSAHLAPITHQGQRRGSALDQPVPTLTTANRGEQALIAAMIAQHNGGAIGRSADQPMSALTTRSTQQQIVQTHLSDEDAAGAERVAAFLLQYYSSGKQAQDMRDPLGTVPTRGRFALVRVNGTELPIVDIGMRMLSAPELLAAQGFTPDYDVTDAGRLTKTTQIRLIGNSVCPQAAQAVIRANFASPARRANDVPILTEVA